MIPKFIIRSFNWRRLTAVALWAGLLLWLAAGSAPVQALSTTTVNTTAVTDNPNDGSCDLWEALQTIASYNNGVDIDGDGSTTTYHECSTGSGPHLVVFSGAAAGGTITLPANLYNRPFSSLPYITDDITITGPVVIDGGGAAINAHIFILNAGGKLTLMDMVVQNGYSSGGGGAILSLGSNDKINIIGSSFQNNIAENRGGAINANGEINILASNFSGNKALGLDGPGGDYEGHGGAIYKSGYTPLNISLSNFSGNIATEGGGAIYTGADSGQISDTVFNGNIVDDDAPTDDTDGGGAIFNYGNNSNSGLTIIRSVFNGNLSFDAPGGAIQNASGGNLHIMDSSFNGNIAGDLTNEEMGGAIYNMDELDVRRVTFMANVTSRGNGGAVANDRTGEATFANVTFTGNGAPDGDGGAIWNGNTQQGGPASDVTLYNVTLSFNASPNAGAALFNQTDGSHTITLANTIIDALGVPGAGDACNEALTSQGYNIDSGNTCGLNQSTDQTNTDPDLEPPSFNGGPLASLFTQALNIGSPAIDAGSNTVCANSFVGNLDQRSDPRPKGVACDIGAFETDPLVPVYGSDPVPPGPVVVGNTSVGTAITNTFTILSVGNTSLEVSNPTLTGSGAGEFSVLTAFPLTIDDGSSQKVVVQCAGSGIGDYTATLTVSSNAPATPLASYTLECHVAAAPTAGYGSDPAAPGPIDFGEIWVNEASQENLTYFETGNATLTVSNAQLSGPHAADFSLGAYDGSINDGEPPATLPITCMPTEFGVRTAVLTLDTNDPSQPSASYNLVCEGIPSPPAPLAWPGTSYIDGQGGLNSLNGAYDVAVSPDGLHVYVTSYEEDALSVFSRDAATGGLSFVMSYSNIDMNGPYMVAVSPDGMQVYVTAGISDSFLIFNRNAGTGVVSLADVWTNGDGGGTVTGLDYPYGITVSPDGRYIYVTGFLSNALVTFARHSDGTVIYEGALVDAVNLDRPYIPTLSPDGRHLYVTGGHNGASDDGYLSLFARDALDGSLTFVQRRYEGQLLYCAGMICVFLNGLGGAWGVDVSPDGQNVYVASYFDDAIARFSRDPLDGTLLYDGRITNGVLEKQPGETIQGIEAANAEGLDGAMDVKVSPDGEYVYATGYVSDAVAVFGRNPADGALSQVQVLYPFFDLPALDGVREIGLSPDGTAVYVTGYLDDAVVLFHTANPLPTLDSLLPASATAGSGGLTVRVLGQNFVPGAIGQVNGAGRLTTFISPNEIEVELMASDVAAAGALTISADNPAPGGGDSLNSLAFVVTAPNENPVPSIASLVPAGANAGDAAFTLTVNGSNFVSGATVQWNGNNRSTTFVSEEVLTIAVTAEDLLAPGAAVVTAVNPGPGGGSSNAVLFDVAAPGQNPVPTINSIDPEYTVARGATSDAIVVKVTGQNFVPGVQGQWNGKNRPTQFVSETEIRVTLNSLDVAFGGSGAITAVNPEPGGGPSNPATFTIFPFTVYLPVVVR